MRCKSEHYAIRNTKAEDIVAIIDLCRSVYPRDIPYDEDDLCSQITTFPEGNFVATDVHQNIVGASSCLMIRAADYDLLANWKTVTSNGTIANHDWRHGDVLYGVDTMVHPSFKGMGLGRALLLRRVDLAKAIKVKLIRGGTRLAGYGAVSDLITPHRYLDLVVSGQMTDPVLSFILGFGFIVRGLAEHYLDHDPESCGWAAIVDYNITQEMKFLPATEVPYHEGR